MLLFFMLGSIFFIAFKNLQAMSYDIGSVLVPVKIIRIKLRLIYQRQVYLFFIEELRKILFVYFSIQHQIYQAGGDLFIFDDFYAFGYD